MIVNTFVEIEIKLSGTIIPYVPARIYLYTGEPGYPEEGGYCEDLEVYIERPVGKEIESINITEFFSDKQIEDLSAEYYEAMTDE